MTDKMKAANPCECVRVTIEHLEGGEVTHSVMRTSCFGDEPYSYPAKVGELVGETLLQSLEFTDWIPQALTEMLLAIRETANVNKVTLGGLWDKFAEKLYKKETQEQS